MVQYQVSINGTTFEELDNVTGSATINPFGDRYVLTFNDFEGQKFANVDINDTVEIFARNSTDFFDPNESFEKIFEGYIVQSDTRQEAGTDVLDLTVYSFDQLIRNETVSRNQTENNISDALQEIIEFDTPVEYIAGNVEVSDDAKIKRSLQGVKVEEALRFLARRSENEEYGVNNQKEFFFRQREVESAGVSLTDGDITNYNVPERGKETKTKVTCYYDGGDENVTVTLGGKQLQAQADLGTQDPVPFPDEINRPGVTNQQEAIEIARNFVRDREETLAGEITAVATKSLVDVDIGDSINIELATRGLNDEFTIVTKELDYIKDQVTLGIVERRGNQDSLIKSIGQQVKRNELQNADQEKETEIVQQTTVRANVNKQFSSLSTDGFKLTTTGREKIINAWNGGDQPTIQTAILGNSDSISRTDSSVPNFVDSSSVNVAGSQLDPTRLIFSFSFIGDGNVIGFQDSSSDLIFIAKLEEAITDPSDTFIITIADNSPDKSVLTEDGEITIRELFNPAASANLVNEVRFGDGGREPQRTDTSLDSVVDTIQLDNQNVQSASTNSEFQNVLKDNKHLIVKNDTLKLAQRAFVEEAEKPANQIAFDVDYSDGEAGVKYDGSTPSIQFTFDLEYEIDAKNAVVVLRTEERGGTTEIGVNFDGVDIGASFGSSPLGWESFILGNNGFSNPISAGSHTIEIVHNAGNSAIQDGVAIDLFGFVDRRVIDVGNLDNKVHQNNGYLDDPQRYPARESVDLEEIKPRQLVKNATLNVSINNNSNNQSLTIGNGTSTTGDNTSSVTTQFSPTSETINGSLTLDGFGTNGSQTPRKRFNRQEINNLTVSSILSFLNPTEVGRADIEAVISKSEANGITYQEVGQSDGTNLLTRSIYPEFTSDNQAVIASEDIGIDIS